MKYLLFIFTIVCFGSTAFAQTILDFSRSDSASIQEHNQLYEEFLDKGDKKEASRNLDLNAVIFWKHNYFDKAIEFYQKSLILNEQLGNHNGVAGINSNLALIYADKGDYENAYTFFEKTLSVRKMNDEKVGIISALINESVVLNKLSNYDLSVKKLEEALSIAQEMNDEKQMRSIYGMLSETYQKAGNTEKAMYYYEYYKTFNDYVTEKVVTESNEKYKEELLQKQLLELENKNKSLQIQNQNLLISKQKNKIGEITVEQQSLIDSLDEVQMSKKIIEQNSKIQKLENLKLKSEKNKQQTIIFIILGALLIVFVLFIIILFILRQRNRLNKLLVKKNSLINQQKEEIITQRDELLDTNAMLDEKNVLITSSITYAKRIQKAILSSGDSLSQITIESFNIFRPRDIVSGDFYYFREIGDKKIIIVGDCTGHGVSGAFLTLLGLNFLNTIILDKKITSPELILKNLNQQYKSTLNQEKSDMSDGMDAAICVIDTKKSKLEYSGARNPIVIFDGEKIQLVKGTRKSIGYLAFLANKEVKDFEKKIFDITEKTWIYMFSDGITDMFSENGQKYSLKRLLSKIEENIGKPAVVQDEFFNNEIDNWIQNAQQIDDIIFVGLKL